MTEINKDDLFYVCTLIEFTARKTNNRRKVIVNALGIKGITKQLCDAQVNHCLSFEQVSEELIEYYKIPTGNFDTITNCSYQIPSFTAIGRLYSYMILDCSEKGQETEELMKILTRLSVTKYLIFKQAYTLKIQVIWNALIRRDIFWNKLPPSSRHKLIIPCQLIPQFVLYSRIQIPNKKIHPFVF